MRDFADLFLETADFVNGKQRLTKRTELGSSLALTHTLSDGADIVSLELNADLTYNDDLRRALCREMQRAVSKYLRKYKISSEDLVLVVGFGNEGMTADALGSRTIRYLEVSEHYYQAGVKMQGEGRLAAIAGGVSGVTGIASFDVISGVSARIRPRLIIAVDTLAARSPARLQRVLQLSDAGITPGSGVGNAKRSVSFETLGVPVVAVGVPLVIYAKNIILDFVSGQGASVDIKKLKDSIGELVVTLKEIDIAVDGFAKVIATGINRAVCHTGARA